MRSNLPVSQNEYQIDEGTTLMSTTDLQSHVTYANEAFVTASGYPRQELLGQPHNLVRHPDMPPAAFADMWGTLKAGKSWTGLVKNRRKNGDHYWVRANATPIVRDGHTVGYMSVRTKPSGEETANAEQMYKAMREGKFVGHRLFQGLVVRTGLLAWSTWHKSMSTRARIRVATMSVAAASCALVLSSAPVALCLSGLVAASVVASVVLERGIAKPLQEVERRSLALAAGDCKQGALLDRVDEIGMIARAISQAGLNLKAVVDDVGVQVHGLGNSAAEVAQASIDLSARTEEAAASLQQTAASMEQMAGNVKANAGNAREAVNLATGTRDAAESGGSVVANVVETMRGIADSSKRIADITGLIDGIAFQTNILALNAAVEAARAGEQGRGFAVVASEVRNLAQRSASAAREIKTLIESSTGKVADGARHAEEAGQAIGRIVEQARQVSALVAAITASTGEQSDGITQISGAVSELDKTTQQNAAMVEQGAAAAADMRSRTGLLVEAINVYRV